MSLTTRVGLLAGASALMLTGVSYGDGPVEAKSTDARISELEAQIAGLKNETWMNEERAEEVRALVQDVLADADTRASLLQSGMTAGYDDGFVIGSSDGNFSLKLNGLMQIRWIYNRLDLNDGADRDSNRVGFENARTRLTFSGNIGGPQWQYKIQGDFLRSSGETGSPATTNDRLNGGDFTLEDAYINYDMENGWNLMFGQFKVPVNREWLVDEGNQLAVERSIISYAQGAAYTQGLMLGYTGDQFKFGVSYNDGISGIPQTGANRGWEEYDTEYAMTARVDFLFSGTWEQFDDFTSPPGSETGFMVGAAVHYQSQEYGTGDGALVPVNNETQALLFNVDVSVEGDGWNAFANFYYIDTDGGADDVTDGANPYGFVVQAGFYLSERWELFARYEYQDPDLDDSKDMSVITGGVNGYYSPNVKMTFDVGWGINEVQMFPQTVTGWRRDETGQDGQFALRTQLQLTF